MGRGVVITDFNGYTSPGHHLVSFWAEYDGAEVTFGGDWGDVPPMKASRRPSVARVKAWARKHGSDL